MLLEAVILLVRSLTGGGRVEKMISNLVVRQFSVWVHILLALRNKLQFFSVESASISL